MPTIHPGCYATRDVAIQCVWFWPTGSGGPESGSAGSDTPDAARADRTDAAAPARATSPPVAYGDVALTWNRGVMLNKAAAPTNGVEWRVWTGRDGPIVSIGWRHDWRKREL